VNARDRDFFAKHPNDTAYLRPYVHGEYPVSMFEGGILPGQDCWVLVHRIGRGVRCRQPIGDLIAPRPLPNRIDLFLPDGTMLPTVPICKGGAE
jgi:hypothetical protein